MEEKEEKYLSQIEIIDGLKSININVLQRVRMLYNRKQLSKNRMSKLELVPVESGGSVVLYLVTDSRTLINLGCEAKKTAINKITFEIVAMVMRRGIGYYVKNSNSLPDEFI